MKPMEKIKFFLKATTGHFLWLQKEPWLYRSLWEKCFITSVNIFRINFKSLESSSVQYDLILQFMILVTVKQEGLTTLWPTIATIWI